MNLKVDLRQPVKQATGSREPSYRLALGRVGDDGGPPVGSGTRQDSFLTECECPGDCLRDHENE